MGHMDMLNRFFKNDLNNSAQGRMRGEVIKWRLKGHAEVPFWRWVCSWARAMRRPSDLGFDDSRFRLPPLNEVEHLVEVESLAEGMLFALPAVGLKEQREERRRSVSERCEKIAELVDAHQVSMIWCHLNDEGDALEKLIPNSIQVSGRDRDDYKEKASEWFVGERCICGDPLFTAKIARWAKQASKSTCVNGSPKTKSECWPTVELTQTNAMLGAGNDTLLTRQRDNEKSTRLSHTGSAIQTQDTSAFLESTGSPLKSMSEPSLMGALSAAHLPIRTAGEQPDFTPTIATRPDSSEDFSAHRAISGLENSRTIQTCSVRLRCTCGHESGLRRLISKPVMFGWGLNFQHCNHVTFFPSHSFEQYYQSVRRCWRFGQTRDVHVHIFASKAEGAVVANLKRKEREAGEMADSLSAETRDAVMAEVIGATRETNIHNADQRVTVPAFLRSA